MYDGSFEIEKIRTQNEVLESDVTQLETDVAQLEIDLTEAQGQLIGVGQTWQDMMSDRTHTTSYQNTTGRPIVVNVSTRWQASSGNRYFQVSEDNSTWIDTGTISRDPNFIQWSEISTIIPAGWYYRISGPVNSITVWAELR